MTLPQLANIWIAHEATGVSAISWLSYAIFAFIMILYGIAHKAKVIILTYAIWLIMDVAIVAGVLIYS